MEPKRSSLTGDAWTRVRIAVAFVLVTVVALAVDAWLRFWIVPRRSPLEPRRIAAFKKATRAWGVALHRLVTWALRLRVTVEGSVPAEGRYLIVSNHQSSLDVPLLITCLSPIDLKFVAMEELRHGKPTISIVLREGGSVFVSATNAGQDLAALTKFAKGLVDHDSSALIFPAGELERDEGPRPWRLAGIEAIRRVARLPILPVCIDGLQRAPSIGFVARIVGADVKLRIFAPIPCEEVDRDPRQTYERLERMIHTANGESGDSEGT